jgi:hypothetical protein
MKHILLSGTLIWEALEAEGGGDFDALWEVLQSPNVQGYITQLDLDSLYSRIARDQGVSLAFAMVSRFQKVLKIYSPESRPPVVDAEVARLTRREPRSQVAVEDSPLLTIDGFLERHSLELMYNGSLFEEEPASLFMQWYRKWRQSGFDPMLLFPIVLTLVLQQMPAFKKFLMELGQEENPDGSAPAQTPLRSRSEKEIIAEAEGRERRGEQDRQDGWPGWLGRTGDRAAHPALGDAPQGSAQHSAQHSATGSPPNGSGGVSAPQSSSETQTGQSAAIGMQSPAGQGRSPGTRNGNPAQAGSESGAIAPLLSINPSSNSQSDPQANGRSSAASRSAGAANASDSSELSARLRSSGTGSEFLPLQPNPGISPSQTARSNGSFGGNFASGFSGNIAPVVQSPGDRSIPNLFGGNRGNSPGISPSGLTPGNPVQGGNSPSINLPNPVPSNIPNNSPSNIPNNSPSPASSPIPMGGVVPGTSPIFGGPTGQISDNSPPLFTAQDVTGSGGKTPGFSGKTALDPSLVTFGLFGGFQGFMNPFSASFTNQFVSPWLDYFIPGGAQKAGMILEEVSPAWSLPTAPNSFIAPSTVPSQSNLQTLSTPDQARGGLSQSLSKPLSRPTAAGEQKGDGSAGLKRDVWGSDRQNRDSRNRDSRNWDSQVADSLIAPSTQALSSASDPTQGTRSGTQRRFRSTFNDFDVIGKGIVQQDLLQQDWGLSQRSGSGGSKYSSSYGNWMFAGEGRVDGQQLGALTAEASVQLTVSPLSLSSPL